jgi:hypothetical protein
MIRRYFGKLHPIASLALPALLCLLALGVTGCGKKGLPQPSDPSRSFSWKSVDAKPVGNCLAFSGTLEGQYKNLDRLRLELAPLKDASDCPGCPFVAKEVTELSPSDAGFNPDTGDVSFSYCPQKANAYRWRLAGINVFNHLPYAGMNDRLLIVNPEAFAPLGPVVPPAPAARQVTVGIE